MGETGGRHFGGAMLEWRIGQAGLCEHPALEAIEVLARSRRALPPMPLAPFLRDKLWLARGL